MVEWSEQWTLGEDDAVLSGRRLYHEQAVEVVPKLEAEQQIDAARKQGAEQERERLLSDDVIERVWRNDRDSGWKLIRRGAGSTYAERVRSTVKAVFDAAAALGTLKEETPDA